MTTKERQKTFIGKDCIQCGTHFTYQVFTDDLNRYNGGEKIQDCFPYLDANAREIFISGLCGACFDELFAFDPDD